MPLPLIPVAWVLGSSIASFILGVLFGESAAAARIRELQKAILALEELNRQRELEIRQLREEIEGIKKARSFIERFIRFITGEAPELLEKFKMLDQIEQKKLEEENKVRKLYQDVKVEFPEEVAKYELELSKNNKK